MPAGRSGAVARSPQQSTQPPVFGAAVELDPAGHAPRVTAGWELHRGGQLVRASPPSPIKPAPDGRVSRLVGVSLEGLDPGEYELRLTARDEVTGGVARSTEPFLVGP